MEAFVILLLAIVLVAAGFFFGLLRTNPAALLDEIVKYQVLLSSFVAITAVLMSWIVARTNLKAARAAKEDERSSLSSGIKTELFYRTKDCTQIFAAIRYRLYHSPAHENLGDLETFVDQGRRAQVGAESCLERTWPLLSQAATADRQGIIDTIDTLESLWTSIPNAIDMANRALQAEENERPQHVKDMREALDTFFQIAKDHSSVEVRQRLDGWINEAEHTIEKMDSTVRGAAGTRVSSAGQA